MEPSSSSQSWLMDSKQPLLIKAPWVLDPSLTEEVETGGKEGKVGKEMKSSSPPLKGSGSPPTQAPLPKPPSRFNSGGSLDFSSLKKGQQGSNSVTSPSRSPTPTTESSGGDSKDGRVDFNPNRPRAADEVPFVDWIDAIVEKAARPNTDAFLVKEMWRLEHLAESNQATVTESIPKFLAEVVAGLQDQPMLSNLSLDSILDLSIHQSFEYMPETADSENFSGNPNSVHQSLFENLWHLDQLINSAQYTEAFQKFLKIETEFGLVPVPVTGQRMSNHTSRGIHNLQASEFDKGSSCNIWERARAKLAGYFKGKLHSLPAGEEFYDQRKLTLSALCILMDVKAAWNQYTKLRHRDMLAKFPEVYEGKALTVQLLDKLGHTVFSMLKFDLPALVNLFHGVAPLPQLLHELYLERYVDAVERVIASASDCRLKVVIPIYNVAAEFLVTVHRALAQETTVWISKPMFSLKSLFSKTEEACSLDLIEQINAKFDEALKEEQQLYNETGQYPTFAWDYSAPSPLLSTPGETEGTPVGTLSPPPSARLSPHLAQTSPEDLSRPRKISNSAARIFLFVDSFIPVLAAEEFRGLCSAFFDCMRVNVRKYNKRLRRIAMDVPDHIPPSFLYTSLNTAIFIRSRLVLCENALKSANDPTRTLSFSDIYTSLDDLIADQSKKLVNFQISICRSHIFPDLDSYNWQDVRPFFNNDRCSYGILMWNVFLKGLLHDLSEYCAPSLVQSIMGTVVMDGLSSLSVRYTSLAPSRNRLLQMKSDVTYMVSIARSFCHPVTSEDLSSPMAGVSPLAKGDASKVERICSTTLGAMAMLVAPLDELLEHIRSIMESRTEGGSRASRPSSGSSRVSSSSRPSQLESPLPKFGKFLRQQSWIDRKISFDDHFEPAKEYQAIGSTAIDHDQLFGATFDWPSLLVSAPLDPESTYALMSRRTELRENDYPPLTDEEENLKGELLNVMAEWRNMFDIPDDGVGE